MSQARSKIPNKGRKTGKPALDPAVSAAIGDQLKRLYDDVAGQPVPDRFKELLEALSRVEKDT